MYVCPRLPKIVPDLAEMCYAIDLLFISLLRFRRCKNKIKNLHVQVSINIDRLSFFPSFFYALPCENLTQMSFGRKYRKTVM